MTSVMVSSKGECLSARLLNALIEASSEALSVDAVKRKLEHETGRELHVLTQTEAFDGSTHTAVVYRSDEGTVTISYAPRTELP